MIEPNRLKIWRSGLFNSLVSQYSEQRAIEACLEHRNIFQDVRLVSRQAGREAVGMCQGGS